jgi:hypothetical protein
MASRVSQKEQHGAMITSGMITSGRSIQSRLASPRAASIVLSRADLVNGFSSGGMPLFGP